MVAADKRCVQAVNNKAVTKNVVIKVVPVYSVGPNGTKYLDRQKYIVNS